MEKRIKSTRKVATVAACTHTKAFGQRQGGLDGFLGDELGFGL